VYQIHLNLPVPWTGIFYLETLNMQKIITYLLLACILMAGCVQPTPAPAPTQASISLSDGRGKRITLSSPAQRIVSLSPSNTEVLFAVGAGAQVAARDSFSDYPAEAKNIADIGGGFGQLNVETILSLKPDLVLAAGLTPPEQIQQLEDLGLTVYVLPNPKDFVGMYANLETAAQLTGHTSEAARLVDTLKARVAAVVEKIATESERPLVFYELDVTDPNAPFTAGPGTFIDTLIKMAGGENLGATLEGEWVQVSVETLLTRNPQIIILGDFTWGGVTPEKVAARAGWDALSAVKNGLVFTFDDNLVSRPGPRMVDGLEAMAKLLHPELFQ
jgi:iron complex transport system substrate-binding protein